MRFRISLFAVVLTFAPALYGDEGPHSPVPASEAAATMIARPGFEIELVAAEPLVMDPVAFSWGADGRLWVVEMADYPLGLDGKGQFGGRVRWLEDVDGDGRYDRTTVFLDGLGYPTGVMPWRRGVLVTCAPDIFYAEDTDGDGKADHREVLFTGFKEGNQQHRVNGLRWGLDNWIHGANGDSGGETESKRTGLKTSISGRDFRIRPDEGLIEPQTGITQFTRVRDDWGNWFGSKNSQPLLHYVLAEEYLRRNPYLTPGPTWTEVPEIPGAAPVYPRSATVARFNDLNKVNRFTSACGECIYRDELFGPEFYGNSFVCEPVHNLVHREILVPHGSTFKSHRAADEERSEFLASTDTWSRPVMVRTGPDGALWVADMYRETIEHPQWIPKDWQARLDLRAGHEQGRIYRIYPTGKKPRPIGRLDKLSTVELVAALDHPSGTWRDLAQQLLVERQDQAAVEPLKQLLAEAKRPQARLHALCTLDGLKAIDEPVLLKALADKHPGVRRHAIRLSESAIDDSSEIAAAVVKHSSDANGKVRLQLAYGLGAWDGTWDGNSAGDYLAALLEDADSYLVDAVLSSVSRDNVARFVGRVAESQIAPQSMTWSVSTTGLEGVLDKLRDADGSKPSARQRDGASPVHVDVQIRSSLTVRRIAPLALRKDDRKQFIEKLATIVVGLDNEAALNSLMHAIGAPTVGPIPPKASDPIKSPSNAKYTVLQADALRALLNALDRHKSSLAALEMRPELAKNIGLLHQVFDWSRATAAAEKSAEADRLAAIGLLGRGFDRRDEDLALLGELLNPHSPRAVQAAAIAALSKLGDNRVPGMLLADWKSCGPELRAQMLDALLARTAWTGKLLDAVAAGDVAAGEIDATQIQRLLAVKDEKTSARARELLAAGVKPQRQQAVDEARGALKLAGDAARGAQVFEKRCSTCHKLGKVGHAVGPDLTALTDKSPASLLVAILDPNRAVEAKFINYTAVTSDGLTYSGMLVSETGASVTLLAPEGKEIPLLRSDLEALASTSKSLMPEGLEKDLKPQDLADLFALVTASGPPRKTWPGNRPQTVEPEALRGEFYLLPETAEAFGTTLDWESRYGNFGHWQSENDQAAWTLQIEQPGAYNVWLEYACPESSAGNRFLLTAGDNRLRGQTVDTGSWDNYRLMQVGKLELPKGTVRLSLRSDGKPRGALFDLKTIRIAPVK